MKKKNKIFNIIVIILIIVLYIWVISGIHFDGIKPTAKEITKAIFKGLIHPDWSYVYSPDGEDLISGLLDTLAIAALGTVISAVLSIPFAFLATKKIVNLKPVTGLGRFLLEFIRTFPELVLAILFIKAVGPGSFAGVLALGVSSIGMVGKLFSESIDSMDLNAIEALTACGANGAQKIWFAIIPQVLPEFASLTLYRFEINVRSATILGIIGAGGIGTPLIYALQARGWSRVGIILLGIIVMVTIIDLISGFIRKRLV
ncbi:phosphonate transport system permease protein [Clostridium acidisoli DSM 12555]|uniref:Phosphonate transport system permease protein n=1 Tax=Clostridium acidisoli DSM 12555 TaxID=1121291 RepID=A0A1W1XQX3_9CLOT|nr:phosphonate ABC transporter, permease protein PhnE [Clostridium acidisoli]SMC26262.1 phosphonate transport system permease protein [Clostridium acidisoli DSM 12555]